MNSLPHSLYASGHNLKLTGVQDVYDIIGSGLPGLIFTMDDLSPVLFNLSNGILRECFQKLVNYRFPIAIVFPETHPYGERITELAREHARHPLIRFCKTNEEAERWMGEQGWGDEGLVNERMSE